MSLANIANRVVDEIGLPRPNGIASNTTDPLARMLVALANTTLEELCEDDWPQLVVPYTFPTVIGVAPYALPADWLRAISDTMYLASQYYSMRGSLSPAEWERAKNQVNPQSGRYRFRIYGNPLKINVVPTPASVEPVVMEYITSNFAVSSGGLPIPLYATDSDTSVIPEVLVRMGLKWRVKHAKGLDYTEDYNKYDSVRKVRLAQENGAGTVSLVSNLRNLPEISDGYVRENGFGV